MQRQHKIGVSGDRGVRIFGHGDDICAAAARHRDQRLELLRFAAFGQQHEDIAAADHAVVAVRRIAGT